MNRGSGRLTDAAFHCLIDSAAFLHFCERVLLSVFGVPLQRVSGHIRVEHPLDNGDTVNSYHGWGATACPPPLYPRAWGPDGVLEAVGHRAYPWIHGIMWHPERYLPPRPRDVGWIKEVFTL